MYVKFTSQPSHKTGHAIAEINVFTQILRIYSCTHRKPKRAYHMQAFKLESSILKSTEVCNRLRGLKKKKKDKVTWWYLVKTFYIKMADKWKTNNKIVLDNHDWDSLQLQIY